jgi:RecA/RadA recombinase
MAKTKTDWYKEYQKMEGSVSDDSNPYEAGVASLSPSANYIYGNSHLLPFGYGEVLYGPPKGGKSLFAHMKAGYLHQTDPTAIVVKFDTEMRTEVQLTPKAMQTFGIDPKRLWVFKVNAPALIFDQIETKIRALIEEGAPIKYIIIDSINGIQGRRAMNATTVDTQQIGDHALTVKDGLKRIIDTQRNKKIAISIITQVASEMDKIEQMRGNKFKMSAAFALQHWAEYFILLEPNRSKDGRQDLLGNDLVNDELTDFKDKSEKTGHKIRVTMKDSSLGIPGRSGEFTFDYQKGLINVHEEVFRLGLSRNIVQHPNNVTYAYGGKEWRGKEAFLTALQESQEMQDSIIKEIKMIDIQRVTADTGIKFALPVED